jgi:hypothetical protein
MSDMALIDAARGAYQVALSEGLSLAHIAEQSGRPQYWFASNILQVVTVSGRREAAEAVLLDRANLAGLILSGDMLVLLDGEQPVFGDLTLGRSEFERYLGWARAVD